MSLILAVSTSLFAQNRDTTRRRERFGHETGLSGIPDLTAEQRRKIKALRLSLSKESLPIMNELSEKKAHLRTLQTANKPDQAAINSTIDEISQLQSQLMKKRSANHQAIRELLTDDQRIVFDMRTASAPKRFPRKPRSNPVKRS